ncbi:hypothetical protein, partial [Shinella sp. M31]|uniref:hypothetical protein n=1 Tax=Shinella sp. M31 TaxID=3368615 RepID=UPI003B9F7275
QLHQETLERVRRPPEAPPLSFDGRVIGPQFSTVNTRFHKNAENRQVIGIIDLFTMTRLRADRNGRKPAIPQFEILSRW